MKQFSPLNAEEVKALKLLSESKVNPGTSGKILEELIKVELGLTGRNYHINVVERVFGADLYQVSRQTRNHCSDIVTTPSIYRSLDTQEDRAVHVCSGSRLDCSSALKGCGTAAKCKCLAWRSNLPDPHHLQNFGEKLQDFGIFNTRSS